MARRTLWASVIVGLVVTHAAPSVAAEDDIVLATKAQLEDGYVPVPASVRRRALSCLGPLQRRNVRGQAAFVVYVGDEQRTATLVAPDRRPGRRDWGLWIDQDLKTSLPESGHAIKLQLPDGNPDEVALVVRERFSDEAAPPTPDWSVAPAEGWQLCTAQTEPPRIHGNRPFVFCVDAINNHGQPRPVFPPWQRRSIPLQNQRLTVVVRRRPQDLADVTVNGTVGRIGEQTDDRDFAQATVRDTPRTDVFAFPSYRSDKVDVLVQLVDRTPPPTDDAPGPEPDPPRKLELSFPIERIYTGAFRPSVAIALGPAADADYDVFRPTGVPTGAPGEIVATGPTWIDAELALTFTRYFKPKLASDTSPHAGVFASIGLVDLQGGTAVVAPLKSLYVGLEVGWRTASIGIGPVIRRTKRLVEPLSLGSLVDSSDGILTRSAYHLGVGITITPNARLLARLGAPGPGGETVPNAGSNTPSTSEGQ